MTTPDIDTYLWDAAGTPADPLLAALEHDLASLRFDPRQQPLTLPSRTHAAPQRRHRTLTTWALAATLLLSTLGGGYFYWRLQWPSGRPWTIEAPASASLGGHLSVGTQLAVPSGATARVSIARLGTMSVDGGSSLLLRTTTAARHQVDLQQGAVDVRLWSPPGRFVIATPAGNVVDLGCVFSLDVVDDTAHLRVETGWVELQNALGVSLVPAGASASMTASTAPLVPVFDDATNLFREGIRRLETGRLDDEAAADAATLVARDARVRDVYSMLMIALRLSGSSREMVVTAAAQLSPAPAGVSVEDVIAGDTDALWRWSDSLPLPPVKSWLRNWFDIVSD